MNRSNLTRILTLALCLSMASMASCGGSGAAEDTTAPDNTEAVETEPVEEPYSLGKYLEKQDLDGFEYTILAFYTPAIKAIYVDEQTGSLIDDAV